MAVHTERWTFSEGDREKCAMSLIFKADDKKFLVGYVLCDFRNEKVRAEDIARARLMTAAPELLGEAKAFLAEFNAYIEGDDCELPDPSGLLAAIAKAEGGGQ